MTRPQVITVGDVDALVGLLRSGAGIPEDPASGASEPVDQLSHALQCAHELRSRWPEDVELHVAGLVHDIGHLLVPGDDAGHGRAGGAAVRQLLGGRAARLVELHVPAKRYLVATDAAYRDRLSAVSTMTLEHQGGAMARDEAAAFASLPDAEAAVRLREADEAAKVPGRTVPGLEAWRPALETLASRPARR